MVQNRTGVANNKIQRRTRFSNSQSEMSAHTEVSDWPFDPDPDLVCFLFSIPIRVHGRSPQSLEKSVAKTRLHELFPERVSQLDGMVCVCSCFTARCHILHGK